MREFGFIVPEEDVVRAIRNAQVAMRAAFTDGTIDDLLERAFLNVDSDELASIKKWCDQNSDVAIVRSFPYETQETPSINVFVSGESAESYIGNVGFAAQLESGENVMVSAQRWTSGIEIQFLADNPDLARWLYHWGKFAISAVLTQLSVDTFPHGLNLSGGELQPLDYPHAGRLVFRKGLKLVGIYDQTDANRFDVIQVTGTAAAATVNNA